MEKNKSKKENSNISNGCLVAIIIFVILFLIGLFMPSDSTHGTSSSNKIVEGSEWDGSVWQVKSWLKSNLKDPSSIEYVNWSNVNDEVNGGFSVRVKYRAKNSFGGYSIENKIFYLNSSGNVTHHVDY